MVQTVCIIFFFFFQTNVFVLDVKNTLVETVVAPVLSNLPDIPVDVPRIISTTPSNSEVNIQLSFKIWIN